VTYAVVPVKRVIERIDAILQADMPARVAAAGLPAIVSWTYANVLVDDENQLPQCCLDLTWGRRGISAGGGVLPQYNIDIVFALPWIGNQDNYVYGVEMASIAEAVMYDYAQAADGTGTLWTSIPNNFAQGEPVGQHGEWQGGHIRLRLEGAQINYG
jgi:hypothetical protein